MSSEFTNALASLNRATLARGELATSEGRPRDYGWILQLANEAAGRWLRSADWAARQEVGGLAGRLVGHSAWARVAQERGQKMYAWFGPGVPVYVINSGPQESLEPYLSAKRKGR